MEAFEDEGVFWLPGRNADQLPGRLTFDPAEGAMLDIIGGFGEQFNDQTRMLRIHGRARRRDLTLDECIITGEPDFEASGVPRQSYYVNRIIADHLFDESEDLAFDKCSVTFDQLAHWINRPSAKLSLHREKEQLTYPPDRVTIEFELPPDETAEIDDHEELRLTSTWSPGGDNITKAYLNRDTYLELRYPGAQPLDKILDDVKYLQDLLTLATNAPTAPLEITLSRSGKAMKYYAGQLAERARLDAPQSAGRILFEFSAIGGLSTIARWVNVARTYQIVVGSLLSIRYASGLYVENRFNNVVSAAETFHRMRFSNQIMPKAEFKKLCHELVAAVPEEYQRWLQMQIQHANEPRLRGRLAEMAFYAGDAFAAVYDDQEQWAKVVTEIRNRLTHHDQNRAIAFEPGDLHFLTESVFMLVMICLFRECQMEDKVLSAIAASGSTQSLRTKLAPVIPRLQAQIAKK
jgi:hypothetical protein